MLALLSSEPIDLGPLRRIEADVRVGFGGVKVVGFEIGAVTMNVPLKGGVLEASLAALRLYDGNVTGAPPAPSWPPRGAPAPGPWPRA